MAKDPTWGTRRKSGYVDLKPDSDLPTGQPGMSKSSPAAAADALKHSMQGKEVKPLQTVQLDAASAAIQKLRSNGVSVYPSSGHAKLDWNALAGTESA